jgi:pimeloyl-ACP methyl ester carboxylesterase
VRALAGHSFGGAAVTYAVASGFAVERAAILAAPVSLARALDYVSRQLNLSPERAAGVRAELHRRTGVAIEQLELEPLAGRLTIPALIIHSRDDRMVLARAGEQLARAWRGSELLLVDGLGHRRILSDPALIERLLGFFRAA